MDLAPLSACPSLRSLVLAGNVDLASLRSCQELRQLELIGSFFKDISPLTALGKLRRLVLSEVRASDVAPLAGCPSLKILSMSKGRSTRRCSEEDRFCSRLEKAFGKDAVILYGDWGRTPNLRHQPPSPGIGLRRRLASRFEVYLVNEAYTSSRCPSCESAGLEHPRECRRRREPVHHLLRCPNRRCSSPWWHRDVLGALNIRKNGCTALRTGRWHEHFSSRSASS